MTAIQDAVGDTAALAQVAAIAVGGFLLYRFLSHRGSGVDTTKECGWGQKYCETNNRCLAIWDVFGCPEANTNTGSNTSSGNLLEGKAVADEFGCYPHRSTAEGGNRWCVGDKKCIPYGTACKNIGPGITRTSEGSHDRCTRGSKSITVEKSMPCDTAFAQMCERLRGTPDEVIFC